MSFPIHASFEYLIFLLQGRVAVGVLVFKPTRYFSNITYKCNIWLFASRAALWVTYGRFFVAGIVIDLYNAKLYNFCLLYISVFKKSILRISNLIILWQIGNVSPLQQHTLRCRWKNRFCEYEEKDSFQKVQFITQAIICTWIVIKTYLTNAIVTPMSAGTTEEFEWRYYWWTIPVSIDLFDVRACAKQHVRSIRHRRRTWNPHEWALVLLPIRQTVELFQGLPSSLVYKISPLYPWFEIMGIYIYYRLTPLPPAGGVGGWGGGWGGFFCGGGGVRCGEGGAARRCPRGRRG